ncbi:MAG: hypothetical protein AAF039_10380 [Bacteroidota bacterium]
MEPNISLHRVWNHIKRDTLLLKSTLLTTLAICAVLLFAVVQLNLFWNKAISSDAYFSVLSFLYIISGIVLSFSYFREFHNDKSSALYLTLPLSTEERLISIWLSTTIGHTLVFLILGIVFGSFSIFFGSVLFGAEFHFVNLSPDSYWKMIKAYVFLLPVFLFGAATFKKNRRAKTLLLVAITVLGLVFFNMFLFGILNYGMDVFDQNGLGSKGFDLAQKDFSGFGKFLFMTILGPGMLLATYFKIREKEG